MMAMKREDLYADLLDAGLTLGASLRLARLIRVDTIWYDLVGEQLDGHVVAHASGDRGNPAHSLGFCTGVQEMTRCPHCLGWWTTALVVGTGVLARVSRRPSLVSAWRAGCAALGIAYAVGHVSDRLDRYADDMTGEEISSS